MSKDYQAALNNLKRKIETIISKYKQSSSDKLRFEIELTEAKIALENSNNKVKELESRISNLLLAEAFKTSSVDVKEAKQKIGKIVKEIDKCIALLND